MYYVHTVDEDETVDGWFLSDGKYTVHNNDTKSATYNMRHKRDRQTTLTTQQPHSHTPRTQHTARKNEIASTPSQSPERLSSVNGTRGNMQNALQCEYEMTRAARPSHGERQRPAH